MADTYKSQATKISSTGTTTIYSGVVGTAILNSINISNASSFQTSTVSVYLVKSGTSYSIISNVLVPLGGTLQLLDAPMVCASGDTVTVVAGTANVLEVIVSILEIT
jgi:hypothetical protein